MNGELIIVKSIREAIASYLEEYEEKLRMIQMNQEADSISRIREGNTRNCQILFCGGLGVGKTTLLNALFRRDRFAWKVSLEGYVVKFIDGMDEEEVLVRTKQSKNIIRINRKELDHWIHSQEAEEIKQIEVFCKLPWPGVTLIDTSPLGINNELLFENGNTSDVIVLVMNATCLLNCTEKDYIEHWFAGRQMKNVFFVINHSNLIPVSEIESVKINLKHGLQEVFQDETGRFDADLFEKRVFFVDAHFSECARRGKPMFQRRGSKLKEVFFSEEDDQYSGVPDFEHALSLFISRDMLHDRAVFILEQMRNMTEQVYTKTYERISLLEGDANVLVSLRDKTRKDLKVVKASLKQINWEFDFVMQTLKMKISQEYDLFCWDVEKEWERYFQEKDISFGIIEQGKLAAAGAKSGISELIHKWKKESIPEQELRLKNYEIQKILAPVNQEIETYIQIKTETLMKRIVDVFETEVSALSRKLADYCMDMQKTENINFEKIFEMIFYNNEMNVKSTNINLPMEQMILSLLLFQNATLAYDTMFQKYSIKDLLMEGAYRKIYYSGVTAIIGVLTGTYLTYVVAVIAYNLVRQEQKAQKLGNSILLGAKTEVVKALHDAKQQFLQEMEEHMLKVIYDSKQTFEESLVTEFEKKTYEYEVLIKKQKEQELYIGQEMEHIKEICSDMKRICNEMECFLNQNCF